MRAVIELVFDDAKADAYNAELFGGDAEDPIVGDGRSLIRELLLDDPGDLVEDWRGITTAVRILLDDEVIVEGSDS